jgi:hypothetical protein
MGQAPTKKTVEANEFVLRDGTGIARATLGFVRNEPTLTLIDANGRKRANLGTEAIDFDDSNGTTRVLLGSSTAISYRLVEGRSQIVGQGPGLMFSRADKRVMMDLRGLSEGAAIYLYGETQNPANSREQAVLKSSVDGPSLTLSDAQGFQTVVGSASLITPSTGESSKTSAASLVLFDKDKGVIWKEP